VVPLCGSYADPRYIGLHERSTRDPTWIFSRVGLTWTYIDVTYGVSSPCVAAAALSDGNTQEVLILAPFMHCSNMSFYIVEFFTSIYCLAI
jgi:hypothetical protein